MAYFSGLGAFRQLPAEIRIQIWEHFLPSKKIGPCPADGPTGEGPGTDLRILRASKVINDEVSDVLYSKSTLRLDLTPIYSDKARLRNRLWCIAHFKSRYQDNDVSWRIRESGGAGDSPICRFPFHLIAAVEVSLLAPKPTDARQTFWLWAKVQSTIDMFRGSPNLPPLTIRLDKFNDQDWDGTDGTGNAANNSSSAQQNHCHSAYVLPFYCIPTVQSVRVETHSEQLRKKLDWSLLDEATKAFFNKSKNEQLSFYQNAGSELDGQLHRNLLLNTQPTLIATDRRRLRGVSWAC